MRGLRPIAWALSCYLTVSFASAQPARQQSSRLPVPDPQWGVLVFGGVSAGRTRLIELIVTPWSGDYGDNYFFGGALSRRLGRFHSHWLIDLEVGAGYRFKQVNSPETWAAIFLRYDAFPWTNRIYTTMGIGTGFSIVERVSNIEKDAGAHHGQPEGSKLLHYLAPEFTFSSPSRRDSEVVIRFHHRSGIFGVYNGVRGGSNVVTVGFRQRW